MQYTLYPEYQLNKEEKEGLSPWKLRLLREDKLKELRKELENGKPKSQTKYFVSQESPNWGQKVHPLLLNEEVGYNTQS